MNANQLERAAYIAAHAILRADVGSPELACPGARQSHTVDAIAEIIKGVFEIHSTAFDEYVDWWETNRVESAEHPAESMPSGSGKIYTLVQKK